MENKILEIDDELLELKRILEKKEITTVFQPIVSLKDGNVIGYESLSRGPVDSILHNPDKLFKAAEDYNMLWDLELLCRVKAIERARNIKSDKFLFINVDPHILKDEKFKRGFTKEFLAKHNMSPETIIFEITEKTCVEDYKTFKAALKNYVDQGYKIAIDDTGSGYSGLKMLSETKPHYVKIDMDLIRDIDMDHFKQSLIKSFVTLAEVTQMKLIAEGIETKDELMTLINLGVHAGQGFFLQRPANTFVDISKAVITLITDHNRSFENRLIGGCRSHIGQIARKDMTFQFDVSCNKIKSYFEKNSVMGACIVKDEYPIGLIMENKLNSALATPYGVAVFSKRPVSLVMDETPLIVDYYSTVTEVSKAAMDRANENLYDYVIVTKDSKYYGVVTIRCLLEYATQLEYNYAKELNPLTGLPGNLIIDSYLKDINSKCCEFCVLYLDLNNFKAYNDTYGFDNGDKILRFTGELIQRAVKAESTFSNFVGHIGGDDFICVIQSDLHKCSDICEKIINAFDIGINDFFNEKDKINGFIVSVDRKGNFDRFELTSISIAGIYKSLHQFSSIDELIKEISTIKKDVKKMKGSSYLIKSY